MNIKQIDLIVLILIGFLSVSDIICEQNESNSDKLANESNSIGEHRAKRRIQDVEKLMNTDEMMALLVCEVCDRNDCIPDYCAFCKSCLADQSSQSILNKFLNSYLFTLFNTNLKHKQTQ